MTLKKYLAHALLLFTPVLLRASEFQVKVIRNASDLPGKFCSIWKEGDYLISDGKNLVLMGGTERILKSYYKYPIEHTMGSILGFSPLGENYKSDLVIGAPYIRIGDKSKYLAYDSIGPSPRVDSDGSLSLLAIAHYEGEKKEKIEIKTAYRLIPQKGMIDITSHIKNAGMEELRDIHYSLYFNASQVYSFSPFGGADQIYPSSKIKHPELPFWVYPKNGYYLGWIDFNSIRDVHQPISRESTAITLAPSGSFEFHYVLLINVAHGQLLQEIYQVLGIQPSSIEIAFQNFEESPVEIVVLDPAFSIFFSTFLETPRPLKVILPEGTYLIRANAHPSVVEKSVFVDSRKESRVILEDLPRGKVQVKIIDSLGGYVPGKVAFFGLDQTKTPYFKPENPIETRNILESHKNSCYPGEDGLEKILTIGKYVVCASRGTEYSLDQRVIEVLKDSEQEIVFHIDKVVDKNNLISVDPHMHTLDSDGSVMVAERIKSIIAEGVDVAVSADHNYVSDYPSTLKKLGLDEYMAAIAGEEVSPLDLNGNYMPEFNRYPLLVRKNEPGNGAIDIHFYDGHTALFEESRKRDPGSVVQINHPQGDYFDYYHLDPESASSARKGFDAPFDILEVLNGLWETNAHPAVENWLHLLNRGYFFPLVGSSDSHQIDKDEPGYWRTYVIFAGKKAKDLDEQALILALKKGRSFASNGPIIEFKINEKYVPGDFLTEKRGELEAGIKVQSAPWVSVNEVRVIINGERKIIIPIKVRQESIVKIQEIIHLRLKEDSYIVVEASGNNPLFPVVQKRSPDDGHESGMLPYALTNPIFIDVDGNGRFDPPWPDKIKFFSSSKD